MRRVVLKTEVLATVLLLLLAGSLLLSAASAAEIRNPGFEQGNKSHEGVGWWWFSTAESCDFDTEVFHSGKRSIRLTVDDDTPQKMNSGWSRYATLSQPLKDLKPDTIYTVRCFIKTDMTAGQAGIAVVCQKEKMQMTDRKPVKFMPLRQTADWTELVYSFKTPPDLTGVTLYCAVESFTGRAWFDDFSIEAGAPIPAIPETADWEQALVLNGFILVGEKAALRCPAVAQSEVKLISSGDRLLIRGVCLEPEMESIKLSAEGRDSAVWSDDSVEIFIDAQRSRSSFYQFIINANGALYDASGQDASWSPQEIQYAAAKKRDRWTFELSIPYTTIGYGQLEAEAPDKAMAIAIFRTRRTAATTIRERSSWQPWPMKMNFGTPSLFAPVTVGSRSEGATVNYLARGQSADSMRPPLAWRIDDPLYEELMTDEPLHPGDDMVLNIAFRGSGLSDMETAFALQHGMKKHFEETHALKQEMRSIYNSITVPPLAQLQKYNQRMGMMPMIQFGGAHYQYRSRPDAPMFSHFAGGFFYPDPRVQKSFAKHVLALLTNHLDYIDEITLGHEGRLVYFLPREYDEIRALYLEQDAEAWHKMEEQAKREYGHGKTGFPGSHADATPLERMVYQRFVYTEYNKGIAELAAALRRVKPDIRLISELDSDGFKPYFYEQIVGAYDLVCQQMLWGSGCNRQSVAFNCKALSDLAETPARGGPHIEHYFVSLTPAEANEVISSVFRVGGTSLQLWLHDWFGKTLGDYYGAPERFHEIVSICRHIGKMRKLRFPQPDTAIFYGNIDQTARHWCRIGGSGGGYEEAFTVLGPRAGSWFKFISDTQLELGRTDVDTFKVVYVPGAHYLEEDIYNKLLDYVKRGGTLVVGDPLSYSMRTDGSTRDTVQLLGVVAGTEIPLPGAMRFVPHGQFPRITESAPLVTGAARLLKLKSGNAAVLAAYADDSPALTLNFCGKGRVLTFAASPFNDNLYGAKLWWDFFQNLQQDLGCAVNHDIWRFRFPYADTPPPEPVPANLLCLTGNSWYYAGDAPVEGPNIKLPFTVDYALPPDHIPDDANFGKLFNRREAMTAEPVKKMNEEITPWVVAWNKGASCAVRLAFQRQVTVAKLRFWVSGDIPGFTFGRLNGETFESLGEAAVAVCEQGDVRELTIDFPPAAGDKFELRIGERHNGILYFSEMELWGNI